MQNPCASLNRQIHARAWLPPGDSSPACHWDVESGGLDLEHRGHGTAHRAFASVGIPRNAGLTDLLAEADR